MPIETKVFDLNKEFDEGMDYASSVIRDGGLVGFPTETVYGLGADAMNEEAVKSIYVAKGRPSNNPLIVHIWDASQIAILSNDFTPLARKLTEAFWPGPFTIILKKLPSVNETVSGGLDSIAIRMPSNPYARELIKRSGRVIAAPSGNLSGKPSPTKAQHMIDDFTGIIPVILDGGDADVGLESTVCDLRGEVPVLLRPGGITAEMIKELAGDIIISPGVMTKLKDGEKALSPGMLYKHYSPNAEVYLAMNGNDIPLRICKLYDKLCKDKKTVIYCKQESLKEYEGRNAVSLGKDSQEIASRLFDSLRYADVKGYDAVIFEGVSTDGVGLAVMNRIIRAAAFKII